MRSPRRPAGRGARLGTRRWVLEISAIGRGGVAETVVRLRIALQDHRLLRVENRRGDEMEIEVTEVLEPDRKQDLIDGLGGGIRIRDPPHQVQRARNPTWVFEHE